MPYEMKTYKRGKDALASPELKKIHPLGKSPVIGVKAPGAEKELIIAESGAIVEYIAEHFGKQLIPKQYESGKEGAVGGETEAWMRYRYFMHYAEGSLMSLLVVGLIVNCELVARICIMSGADHHAAIANAPAPFFIKPLLRMISGRIRSGFLDQNFDSTFKFIEGQLATNPDGGPFFCGNDLSAADVMMLSPLQAAVDKDVIKQDQYPKIFAWLDKIQERESYKAAVKRAEDETGETFVSFP